MSRNRTHMSPSRQRYLEKEKTRRLGPFTGYVLSLRSDFGFIEVDGGDSEDVFFHISRVDLDSRDLHVSDRVEYWLDTMLPRPRAVRVRKLAP